MSCSDNKTAATTDFNSQAYGGSAFNIGLLEETASTDNACTLTSVRGKLQLDLTTFHRGTCTLYVKVSTQTDGSSNSPPVVADETYRALLTATLGIVNTSSYYANSTPTFSGSNDCSASDKKLGWNITDQVGAVTPIFTYFV